MKTPSCIELLEARIAPAFAPFVNLGNLDGSDGFKLSGEAAGDNAGTSVSGAGDVNGDGFADFIVGAPLAGASRHGVSCVVFGKAAGFPANLNLSDLNGVNGFKLEGVFDDDFSGVSVSGAGDVNGDGFADVIVGAYHASLNGSHSGASYIIFGKASPFAASLALSTLDGVSGVRLSGVAADDASGFSVSGAGDVNGDGFADVIIGAPGPMEVGSTTIGASFVVFGKADFSGTAGNLNLSTLDGTNGFKLSGGANFDRTGYSVSGAGDVNGDGFADVIVGAPNADQEPNGADDGAAYVVFGHAATMPFPANLALAALDGTNGFKLSAVQFSQLGVSVSGAGDINGDGLDDLIVSAPAAANNGNGNCYVVLGKDTGFSATVQLSELDGTDGFRLYADALGHSASGAGDVNGDGFADLIVSDPFISASYVVFGHATPTPETQFPKDFNLAMLDATDGFTLGGIFAGTAPGRSVNGAGDVNGDGFDDVIIGAPSFDAHGAESGASFVVFGHAASKAFTFTDPDGDLVTIKTSKGGLPLSAFTFSTSGDGQLLERLDLTHAGALDGTKLTIKATQQMIGGVMRGDGKVNIGTIDATGMNLGKVKIAGDVTSLIAGSGSGTAPSIKNLTIGSLGTAQGTFVGQTPAVEMAGFIAKFKVKGDVVNTTVNVGVASAAGVGQLQIAGQVLGSTFNIGGLIGTLKVSNKIQDSTFKVGKNVGQMIVLNDIENSVVKSGTSFDSLKVGGSIIDSEIRALGKLMPKSDAKAVAIGSLTVMGDVTRSQILAGYDKDGNAMNGDAGIGKVTIKGNFTASSIVAGIADLTADGFGQNDAVISGGNGIIATIASITIKGTATGSVAGGDFFGITAELIKKAKINGVARALTSGKDNLAIDETNGDLRLVEV